MADSGKRPAQGALHRGPSTPTPLGALSPLPEVLLAHLCSFLSGRDLARLGGACAALHESPVSLWPRLRVGLRSGLEAEDEEGFEEERQRRVEALRMLARRAASGLKELRLWHGEVSEAFFSAVREGGRPLRHVTSLHVAFPNKEQWEDEDDEEAEEDEEEEIEAPALAGMLAAGQLPILQELHLFTWGVESVLPVWQAVGEGACPRLKRVEIDQCSSQQLSELAEAMRARPEGCEELKAVRLGLWFGEAEEQAICEALQALLSRLSPNSLEELCLTDLPPGSLQVAIPLLTSGCAALKTLELNISHADAPSVDGLLHALARGAMPSLTSLHVSTGTCSDEAWRALGEAMGPEGTCLRRIKAFKLYDIIGGLRQLEILSRAMGSGHGCPELEVLGLSISSRGHEEEVYGAALGLAFRPPHGLPRLKQLLLHSMNLRDLDQLMEALQHRPHASQPVEWVNAWRCKFEGATALGRAMEQGAALASLKQLSMSSYGGGGEEWTMQLAEALAGGAGQQLEKLQCEAGPDALSLDVANRLLQGLSERGACPRLQSLSLMREPHGVAQGGGEPLDACSLGTILAGRAACSHTLRELRLTKFSLSNEAVRRLAACLREPQAIQLESLELRAGEPDACEAVMELLSALGGRAGDRLRNLVIRLLKCEEGEEMRVAEHVVGIIKAGGLPAMEQCHDEGPYSIMIHDGSGVLSPGHAKVEQALQERAKAQWLASW